MRCCRKARAFGSTRNTVRAGSTPTTSLTCPLSRTSRECRLSVSRTFCILPQRRSETRYIGTSQGIPLPPDRLREAAERLLPAARIVATTSFVPALDRHPLLKSLSTKDWDFFLTVANSFVALTVLASRVPDYELTRTYVWVAAQLHAWDAEADDALMDLGKFAKTAINTDDSSASRVPALIAASGAWVTTNLFARAPRTADELAIAETLADIAASGFGTWWDDDL